MGGVAAVSTVMRWPDSCVTKTGCCAEHGLKETRTESERPVERPVEKLSSKGEMTELVARIDCRFLLKALPTGLRIDSR